MTILIKILFIICGVSVSYAQRTPDSLTQKSYDSLYELYNNESTNIKALKYAQAYLQKAKKEKDTTSLLTGYHLNALLYDKAYMLKYFDSIINLTQNKKNETYPASIYISKGHFYYDKGDLKTALDFYILAKQSAIDNYNPFLIFNSNYSIGIVRDRTSDSIAALQIHKENYKFVKKNITKLPKDIFLSSLYALSNAYNNVRYLDSAKYYTQIGLKESTEPVYKNNLHLFLLNDGTTDYYMKNYGLAISNLTTTRDFFKSINDKANLSESLFFLAKSQMQLRETNKALDNFKIIDTIFQKNNKILPKLRDSYKNLIDENRKQGNLNQQLYYLNQLIRLDSIIHSDEIYLNKTLIKNYDIPKLISEKENIISILKRNKSKNYYIIIVVSFSLILVSILFFIQYITKRRYKSSFDELLKNKEEASTLNNEIIQKQNKNIDVPEDIIKSILKQLEQFELQKRFLSSKVKAINLAVEFNTNTNYLSKIVNYYKKQNFTTYINNLRIDYMVNQLKTNKTYRNYTIKALSREVGFKSAESFSKAFNKRTSIKPSFFIAELEKRISE